MFNEKYKIWFEKINRSIFFFIFVLFVLSSFYYIFSGVSSPDDKMHMNFMIYHDGWFLGQNHHGFGAIFWWIGKIIGKFTNTIETHIIAIRFFIHLAVIFSVYYFLKKSNNVDRILYALLILTCPFLFYHYKFTPEFLNIALVLLSFIFLKKHFLFSFFLMGLAVGIKLNSIPAFFLLLSYYYVVNNTNVKEFTKNIFFAVLGFLIASPIFIFDFNQAVGNILSNSGSEDIYSLLNLQYILSEIVQEFTYRSVTFDLIRYDGIFISLISPVCFYLIYIWFFINYKNIWQISYIMLSIFALLAFMIISGRITAYWFIPYLTALIAYFILLKSEHILFKKYYVKELLALIMIVFNLPITSNVYLESRNEYKMISMQEYNQPKYFNCINLNYLQNNKKYILYDLYDPWLNSNSRYYFSSFINTNKENPYKSFKIIDGGMLINTNPKEKNTIKQITVSKNEKIIFILGKRYADADLKNDNFLSFWSPFGIQEVIRNRFKSQGYKIKNMTFCNAFGANGWIAEPLN